MSEIILGSLFGLVGLGRFYGRSVSFSFSLFALRLTDASNVPLHVEVVIPISVFEMVYPHTRWRAVQFRASAPPV